MPAESKFRRLLRFKRNKKRIKENEALRRTFDCECPVASWRTGYVHSRRICNEGEQRLVEVLDAGLQDRVPFDGAGDSVPERMWPK